MRITVTAYLDESSELIRAAATLLKLYEDGSALFVPEYLAWLETVLAMLDRYGRVELAAVLALKARILAARSGIIPDALAMTRRLPSRKQFTGICALLLGQALEQLSAAHARLETRRDEAMRLVQQMLQLVSLDGRLARVLKDNPSPAKKLNAVWELCRSSADVSAGVPQVLGLVSWVDALRLIDTSLSDWNL